MMGSVLSNSFEFESTFTTKELTKLQSRFNQLDKLKTGAISLKDLQTIPELAVNPLADRIASNSSKEWSLSVQVLVELKSLNVIIVNVVAFKIYDVDGDGKISEEDLRIVLKAMVGKSLGEEQVLKIAKETISDADLDKDGFISFEEFKRVLFNSKIEQIMNISFA